MSDELRDQVNEIIKNEIQDVINDYVDEQEEVVTPEGFSGAVKKEDAEKSLKVNIPNDEIDKIIKEYKRIKRFKKSNIGQIKKLGLVDKHGRPL